MPHSKKKEYKLSAAISCCKWKKWSNWGVNVQANLSTELSTVYWNDSKTLLSNRYSNYPRFDLNEGYEQFIWFGVVVTNYDFSYKNHKQDAFF